MPLRDITFCDAAAGFPLMSESTFVPEVAGTQYATDLR